MHAKRCVAPLSQLRRSLLAAVFILPLAATLLTAQRPTNSASAQDVRGLGRLERPDMVPVIRPFLSDSSPAVRAEAAGALAQALWPLVRGEQAAADSTVVALAAGALRSRLRTERAPVVVASIAASLGRLPYRRATERHSTERAIAALLAAQRDAIVATGAARGLESLVRSAGRDYSPSASTIAILRSLVRSGGDGASFGESSDTAFVRPMRLALMTLISARAADSATIGRAMHADDAQLRRLAALAASTQNNLTTRRRVLGALLLDSAPMVRVEAVRAWSRTPGAECAPLLRAVLDEAPHVSITAIDAVGSTCVGHSAPAATSVLANLLAAGAQGTVKQRDAAASPRLAMHRAAHAIVSLARVSPERAVDLLGASLASSDWQVRAYAARAAGVLNDTAALERLADDAAPNVRTEAIAALAKLVGHSADSVYVSALAATDYQLVLTAAQALRGTPRALHATHALLAALARITAEKRETSRDPRMAILESISELGSADVAGAIMPYLVDFDPVLADSAAAIISRWAGRKYSAAPRPLPEVDRPLDDSASMRDVHVRVTMAARAGGGSFELQLFPEDAPATVSRFARLARAGYYDGLTVHRIVPDFVIQGGSPGANEYMGDGPFMRDEVGRRSHERGTVGISTRGRDTGDAQFFINLVDNPRLDHEYTVFARVVSGMPVVDQLLEGDVMQRVEVLDRR